MQSPFYVEAVLSYKVLHQDLETHQDEDQTAEKLSALLVFAAENTADFYAEHAANKRRHTNKRYGWNDVHLQEGKADADGKSIDACSNGERNHGLHGEIVVHRFIVFARFPNHVIADHGQQGKGNIRSDCRN